VTGTAPYRNLTHLRDDQWHLLIRGKYVICKVVNRNEAQVIEDGAVFQRDGNIVEVGKFEALSKKHRPDETLVTAHPAGA
jgi:cytosine/adenosine deaminase-related metal-dependent hydrolase